MVLPNGASLIPNLSRTSLIVFAATDFPSIAIDFPLLAIFGLILSLLVVMGSLSAFELFLALPGPLLLLP